jgi:multiple sugar transport system ATP-binding protein
MIGDAAVIDAPGVPDKNVYVGIRPEGFTLDPNGPLCCKVAGIDVMGRDISVISTHDESLNPNVRSIISADEKNGVGTDVVRFTIKPHKIFIFDGETEERIHLSEVE